MRRAPLPAASSLEAAGGTLEDVVQTTDYITTTENYRGTADIRRELFRHPLPTPVWRVGTLD